ncbi:MAG: hypothetical protein WCA53_33915, partial [Caballeronia sp.]
MILNPLSRSERRRVAAGLLSVIALSLTACSPSSPAGSQVAVPHRVDLLSGDSGILNYTPWYIHRWELSGPNGTGIGGG